MAFFSTFYSLTSPKEIQLRRAFSQQYLLTPNVINIISKESDESLISRYIALFQRTIVSKIQINFQLEFTSWRWHQTRRVLIFSPWIGFHAALKDLSTFEVTFWKNSKWAQSQWKLRRNLWKDYQDSRPPNSQGWLNWYCFHNLLYYTRQKQLSRRVLRKRCCGKMQQVY